jgi:hypothetical protein
VTSNTGGGASSELREPQYIIRAMYVWARRAAAIVLGMAATGCHNPLGKQYEYEEQLYLSVGGAATMVIDTSIPALVALRGLPIDPSPRLSVDRDQIRRLYSVAGCPGARVGQPWVRRGRHFIQISVKTDDVRRLGACGPLAWSTYTFEQDGSVIHYKQVVGAPAGGDPGAVNWTGQELVAFKLHLPSRIIYHNVKRLEDGSNGEPDRGNILTWEQWLRDRRAGAPVTMDVRMDSESILYRTLWLFAGAFVAAVLVLMTLIWMTMRRAKGRALAPSTRRPA